MPRPILGTPQAKVHSSRPQPSALGGGVQGPKLQQRLRQTRSAAYINGMKRIDAGTHHADNAALNELIDAIAQEFPELGIEQRPLGIVSRCYLGAPYEAHICDIAGGIVEHFETFRPMPPLYERARSLAAHSSYAFIEIYHDMLRAVSADGTVSVIEQ